MVTNLQKYQKQSFSSLLYLWLPPISKRSPLKVFLPVKLLLLTLRTRFLVGNLKKKNSGNSTLLVFCAAAN